MGGLRFTDAEVLEHPLQGTLLEGIERIFRSLGRLLVEQGVGARKASEAVKRAMVFGARDYFGEKGWPCTFARTADFTGMTTREIQSALDDGSEPARADLPVAAVAPKLISLWWSDPEYLLQFTGEPRALPLLDPDGRPSFTSLLRKCDVSLDPSRVLAELVDTGAVRRVYVEAVGDWERRGEMYEPTRHTVIHSGITPAGARYLNESMLALVNSTVHSLRSEPADRFINRRAFGDKPLGPEARLQFRDYLDERVGDLIKDAVNFLNDLPEDPHGERMGIHIFQYASSWNHNASGNDRAPAG